jgi:hypothetical protein
VVLVCVAGTASVGWTGADAVGARAGVVGRIATVVPVEVALAATGVGGDEGAKTSETTQHIANRPNRVPLTMRMILLVLRRRDCGMDWLVSGTVGSLTPADHQ